MIKILSSQIGKYTTVFEYHGDVCIFWFQSREEWDVAIAALSPADPAITVIVDEDEEGEHELLHAATA